MKYLIVYEKSNTGWGAYAPDLPGLGAAGKTLDEVKELIREAVEFHLEGMREHVDPFLRPARRPNTSRSEGHGLTGPLLQRSQVAVAHARCRAGLGLDPSTALMGSLREGARSQRTLCGVKSPMREVV